jgi:hypothetical protein
MRPVSHLLRDMATWNHMYLWRGVQQPCEDWNLTESSRKSLLAVPIHHLITFLRWSSGVIPVLLSVFSAQYLKIWDVREMSWRGIGWDISVFCRQRVVWALKTRSCSRKSSTYWLMTCFGWVDLVGCQNFSCIFYSTKWRRSPQNSLFATSPFESIPAQSYLEVDVLYITYCAECNMSFWEK